MIHYSKFNHRVPQSTPKKKRLVYTSRITMTATFPTYQQNRQLHGKSLPIGPAAGGFKQGDLLNELMI